MSANILIYIINQTPGFYRIWKRLSSTGKRRAIELADGDENMLDLALEDALDEEN